METIIQIYFIIVFISCFATFLYLLFGDSIEGVDNFWDWLAYNLLWPIHILKGIIKMLFRR